MCVTAFNEFRNKAETEKRTLANYGFTKQFATEMGLGKYSKPLSVFSFGEEEITCNN